MQTNSQHFWNGPAGLLLCVLILLPSYFINNGDSHDWGGDFSLYIKQAENIVAGTPQIDNGYIYNEECPGLGPPTYPIGFPLILAPVLAVFGNDMPILIDLMAILFILLGVTTFWFFRMELGMPLSLLVAATLVYHPELLAFKREVMSDIPFALFILLSLLAAKKEKWVLAALLIALTASIRSIGLSLIMATAFAGIHSIYIKRKWSWRSIISEPFVRVSAMAIGSYLILNHLLFSTASEGGYNSLFGRYPLLETITTNLDFYHTFFLQFLINETNDAAKIAWAIFLAIAAYGWYRCLRSRTTLAEIWVPIYLLTLLVYPYRGAGLRFMLPIIPFLFYYAAIAIHSIGPKWKPALALLCIPLVFNAGDSLWFAKNWPRDVSGPQSAYSQQLFDFVLTEIPFDESILFLKPRVLALYTDHRCMSNERKQSVVSLKAQLDSIQIDHLLQCNEIGNACLDSFLLSYPELVTLEYENPNFKLYGYRDDAQTE